MKQIIKTDQAPLPIGPYNQATIYNGMVFLRQIAIDPESGALVMESIEEETHRVMQNIKALLEASGSDFSKVLKVSVFVKDIALFSRINAVYATYFEESIAPARELVQVAALLVM